MTYKHIDTHKGLYKISDTGEVLALSKKIKMPNGGFKVIKEHKPKISITRRGYLKVMLTNYNGIRKGYFVHRLVGNAFIKNKFNKPQINHKDKNPFNNNVSNLEWVTNRENAIHRIDKNKTSSKYFGVTKKRNSWQALFRIKAKVVYVGSFKNEEDAHKAVKKAYSIELKKLRTS